MLKNKDISRIDGVYIENREFFHKIAFIAMPIAVQSVITSSLSLVDNLMVGSLGETELAAVGAATQIYFVHWMMNFGFTSGVATYMAQFLGAKDEKGMKSTIGIALVVCMLLSSLFFVVAAFFPQIVMQIFTDDKTMIKLGSGYIRMSSLSLLTVAVAVPFQSALRVTKQTHLPLFISVAAFSVNTFLNYCLIFGNFGFPKMGVLGASLATLIARIIEFLAVLTVVFIFKNRVSGSFTDYFSWKKEVFFRVIKNALPTMGNETLWGLGNAMYVAAYARVGVTAYAAVQVGNVINSLFSMAGFSLGDAALILIGEKLGQGDTGYAYSLGKKILKTAVILGIVSGIVLFAVSPVLVSLFKLTQEGKQYAIYIIGIYALFMWLVLYNGICVIGILRAGGDTLYAMCLETGSVWLYAVPMAFGTALFFKLPIYWVVFFVKTEEIVKFLILTRRIISQKWVKNVVKDIVHT